MLGQVNNTEIVLSNKNKNSSAEDVVSLADALIKCPDKLSDQFELRINHEWLMSLDITEYSKVFSFMTDLDLIAPLIKHKIIKEYDSKQQQHIYKFIRNKNVTHNEHC